VEAYLKGYTKAIVNGQNDNKDLEIHFAMVINPDDTFGINDNFLSVLLHELVQLIL
jgi:hypothetical protein